MSYIKLLIVWQFGMAKNYCYLHYIASSLLGSTAFKSLVVLKCADRLCYECSVQHKFIIAALACGKFSVMPSDVNGIVLSQ